MRRAPARSEALLACGRAIEAAARAQHVGARGGARLQKVQRGARLRVLEPVGAAREATDLTESGCRALVTDTAPPLQKF